MEEQQAGEARITEENAQKREERQRERGGLDDSTTRRLDDSTSHDALPGGANDHSTCSLAREKCLAIATFWLWTSTFWFLPGFCAAFPHRERAASSCWRTPQWLGWRAQAGPSSGSVKPATSRSRAPDVCRRQTETQTETQGEARTGRVPEVVSKSSRIPQLRLVGSLLLLSYTHTRPLGKQTIPGGTSLSSAFSAVPISGPLPTGPLSSLFPFPLLLLSHRAISPPLDPSSRCNLRQNTGPDRKARNKGGRRRGAARQSASFLLVYATGSRQQLVLRSGREPLAMTLAS